MKGAPMGIIKNPDRGEGDIIWIPKSECGK